MIPSTKPLCRPVSSKARAWPLGSQSFVVSSLAEGLNFGQKILVLTAASVGGAVGGAAYYGLDGWRARGGMWKTVANVLSLLAYCFAAFLAILLVYQVVSPK